MASSCILDNTTFVCSYTPMEPAPGLETFIHFFRTPEWIFFCRTVLDSVSDEDFNTAYTYLTSTFQYLIVPIFCAYMCSPSKQDINIYIPENGPATMHYGDPEPEDMLDPLSKEVLEHLRRRPSGTTAKMLYRSLQVYHPELELFEMNGMLYMLSRANHITRVPSAQNIMRWKAC